MRPGPTPPQTFPLDVMHHSSLQRGNSHAKQEHLSAVAPFPQMGKCSRASDADLAKALRVIKRAPMPRTPAPFAAQALDRLRDPSAFEWYVIPLLLIVVYLYAEQIAQRRWSVVLGAFAFWLMDWINEIWNGVLFHLSGYAPAWATPGDSAYVILIGLNVEITLMFAVMGLYAVRILPVDRTMKIAGVDNRIVLAVVNAWLCVGVEVLLNRIDALTWEWSWWSARSPWLIFLIGYLPFFLVAYWVHDMASRRRQVAVVGLLASVVGVSLAVFGGMLGWL
jgi:hypothetical protein